MYEISKKLVRSISVVLSLLLLLLFLAIDFTLDAWVEKRFDDALLEKANYLVTLVKENKELSASDFPNDSLTQLGREFKDEFLQLWCENGFLIKSESFQSFTGMDLARTVLPLNSSIFLEHQLPDGRDGRILVIHFSPRINPMQESQSLYLSIAVPVSDLQHLLLLFDISLLLTFFLTILFARYLVMRVVKDGLAPLQLLNEAIKKVDITQSDALISKADVCVAEIEPIRRELNKLITDNKQLIEFEKRMTSDIAHEIKTPIAEIISLTEMSIKYPDEQRINATYKEDILTSANRLKEIVHNLLLLNRYSDQNLGVDNTSQLLTAAIQAVFTSLAFKYPQQIKSCVINNPDAVNEIRIDEFYFHTILSNLLDNAFFYGKEVEINILKVKDSRVKIEVVNTLLDPLTEKQLAYFFEPFYQVDSARTDADHHGLGLAIIKKLSDIAHYKIALHYQEQKIYFSFEVPGS